MNHHQITATVTDRMLSAPASSAPRSSTRGGRFLFWGTNCQNGENRVRVTQGQAARRIEAMDWQEVLKRFCDAEFRFPEPFIVNGQTIALDGRTVIFLDHVEEWYAAMENPPSFAAAMDGFDSVCWEPFPEGDWTLSECPMPRPHWIRCAECCGDGYVWYSGRSVTCPVCGGDGGQFYEDFCGTCEGRGWHCAQEPTFVEDKTRWFRITSGVEVQTIFLAFFADLPHVQIGHHQDTVFIRFDGGRGAIMGRRQRQTV